jgi:hypothetical protein
MAELFCREANRIDPPRVHRSRRRIGRATFAPSVKIVCELLQHGENAPLIGQGCASLPPGSADRTHRVACHGRRTASSIRPNLSFRYTQPERRDQTAHRRRWHLPQRRCHHAARWSAPARTERRMGGSTRQVYELETIAPLSDDPIVKLPVLAA